jgi:hypothetical protein
MENMTEKQEEVLHHIMCISGGFMGGYALFSRVGNFGSAQTANLIEIILNIFGRDYKEVSLRVFALLLFILGNVSGALIKQRFGRFVLKIYTFAVLILGFVAISFIPEDADVVLALLPIFFMSSVQWFTFTGTRKYNCSTIFSTNNLKQMVLGYTYYHLTGKDEDREKGRFYLLSLTFFHIGVVLAVLTCLKFGIRAGYFGIIIVIVAEIVSIEREVKQNI